MKRIFSGLFSLITALALVMPAAAPVFAESDGSANSQLSSQASLMIKAPNMTDISQPVTITVFGKQSRGTVAGAAVYALKTSDLVISADKANYTSILADYEALAEAKGMFIGNTGEDGAVKATFTETGRYLLVATRDGYVPGFSRITVTLAAVKGLNLRNPGAAELNKEVTFTVTERYSSTAVAGASIYAQLISEVSTAPVVQPAQVQAQVRAQTQAQVQAQSKAPAQAQVQAQVIAKMMPLINAATIKADPADTAEAEKNAATIKESGIYLGNTDDKGRLAYTFTASGTYVLTAIKESYSPGFSRISIFLADQKKLGVKSPASAETGANVDFFVIARNTGQAVPGAALWALRMDNITGTAEPVWNSLVSGSAQADVIDKYKGLAQQQGILLGYSGDDGKVSYTFAAAGRYLLVAVKDEYAPGFGRITVTLAGQPKLSIKVPRSANTGQQVTMKVSQVSDGQPVEQAAVYAFKSMPMAVPPVVQQVPPIVENGTATQVIIDSSSTEVISTAEAQALMVQSQNQPLLLGYTGSNGELQYTFTEAARYTLVAFKEGYLPGGARINILGQGSTKALEINAFFNMAAGQPVIIMVKERPAGQPVSGAAVYVLKISDAADVKSMPPTAKNDKAQNDANKAKAKERGAFAGYTSESGQVTYSFSSSGQYFLAAFKDGYEPGFNYITYILPVVKKAPYPWNAPPTGTGNSANGGSLTDNSTATDQATH
ncbi:MAG: hypothetical protein PHO26_07975 [Dehalococcoidia bacterium]|nr:hypothetical protein [Dehalococcoidia bacterium]MDD5493965.1 hypothetical protein [Dehalococcoidia bacterium]